MVRTMMAVVAGVVALPAASQVLFEQLPIDGTSTAPIADSAYGDDRFAESFTATSDASIGTVVVWGGYLASVPDVPSFTVEIYRSVGGTPIDVLMSATVAPVDLEPTGFVDIDLVEQLRVPIELPEPFDVEMGRTYFVSVTANSADRNEGAWVWNESDAAGTVVGSPDGGSSWFLFEGSLAIRLEAAPVALCRADTNGDGAVTPGDFNAWILAFNTQGPACDQNDDDLCTAADFDALIRNFGADCD
ncbi:MAG: hypothetical protein AAF937_08760 [Planctomycetota bacterium]